MDKRWFYLTTDDMAKIGLTGNDLNVYAIIASFTRVGGCYYGTQQHLAEMIGVKRYSVQRILGRLINRGLIIKQEAERNGIDTCKYWAVLPSDYDATKCGMPQSVAWGITKCGRGVPQDVAQIIKKNNKDNKEREKENIIDKSIIEKKDKESPAEVSGTLFPPDPEKEKVAPKEKAPRRFVKPTIEEVEAFCDEHNINIDAYKFWYYYESKGWQVGKNPMKNWKAAVRTWERNGNRYDMNPSSQPAARGQRTQRTGMADFKNVNAEYEGMRPLLESDFDEETLKELNKGIS